MINLSEIQTLKSFLSATSGLSDLSLKVSVDNRFLDEKTLFVAIVGARYNPLENLDRIVAKKTTYVLCESQYESLTEEYQDRVTFIFVDEIEKAIGEIGTKVAEQFKSRDGVIAAISGSNGKTTTKEMLFHLVQKQYGEDFVICTQKNNNNHLGVPFTLFQIRPETKFAIVELGSNHPGEIEFLCDILKPQFALTTNIGATHLEFFGTEEAVFKEEASVAYHCETFFQNLDDRFLKKLDLNNEVISYGENSTDNKFSFGEQSVFINSVELKNKHITGKHNFINLGLAWLVASTIFKNESNSFIKHAESFTPTSNRSEWVEWKGRAVFLDAYNANPSSMKLALEGFFEKASEKCCVVLGDMNELGSEASLYHKELGSFLNHFTPAKCFFIGRYADDYSSAYKGDYTCFESTADFVRSGAEQLENYDYVFIKGSRSLQLESILDI